MERKANCAIGNGFHCPSLMLVMVLLLQAAGATAGAPTAMSLPIQEAALIGRIRDTVYDDHYLQAMPGIMSSDACIDEMMGILDDAGDPKFPKLPWRTTRTRLRGAQ